MTWRDRLLLGWQGLAARRTRTALSAIGISLGITALVAVLGLSESSKADLKAQLDRLGTNMLTVSPGQSLTGGEAVLPQTAPGMVRRIPTVEASAAIRQISAATARKTDRISTNVTSGINVYASDLWLNQTVRLELATGRWLDAAVERYPAVVLGSTAARRLAAATGQRIWIMDRWFYVIGVLKPDPIAPDLDTAALIGLPIATALNGTPIPPSKIYTRVDPTQVVSTSNVLAPTANPATPTSVSVSRPSDALAARAAVDSSLRNLTLGLGAVALLVGAVGIANVMVIAVLERRREIGVRRALGATRGDIGAQFLVESVMLSALGGVAGALLGLLITLGWSIKQSWELVVPWAGVGLGLMCSLIIGSIVGFYPALRAASVPPTEALRSS